VSVEFKSVIAEAFGEKRFAKLKDDDASRLAYMKTVWGMLNDRKFGGKMKMPNFRFLKDQQIEKFRGRGNWNPSGRTIALNRRVFTKYNLFYEVFLHEMCHQATWEISDGAGARERRIAGGHGPTWMSWMKKVGLDPTRYDQNDNTEYMTADEKEAHQTKIANKEKIENNKKIQQTKIQPWEIRAPMPAKYYDAKEDKWYPGMIVGKSDKGGKRWMFVPVEEPNNGGWMIIPNDWFYKPTDKELKDINNISKYRLETPVDYQQRKQDRRDQRRDMRSFLGY
jgi:predicted SprT family Zn-dependent metalloprotease